MAKNPTDKSKYRSKYTPNNKYITCAQYVAEIMCERQAQKNMSDLPIKFWDTKKWKGQFFVQVREAQKLISKYGDGNNMFQKAINSGLFLTTPVPLTILTGWFLIGKERLKSLGWPFMKIFKQDQES